MNSIDSGKLLLNDTNDECGYRYCAKYNKRDYTKVHDISTLNQYNLSFDYTLAVLGLNTVAEIFSIQFITDTQTITIASYNSETLFNKTNFSLTLDESLWNQASITINFSMTGSGNGDLAYLYKAIIYNDIQDTTNSKYEKQDSISFGAEYEDIRYV